MQKRADEFVAKAISLERGDRDDQVIRQLIKILDGEAEQLGKSRKYRKLLSGTKSHGLTLLNDSVKRGWYLLARLLLKYRLARPNAADSLGKTAIHHAVEGASDDFFTYLVDTTGADVNAMEALGLTALHLAVYYNKPTKVDFLLSRGAFQIESFFGLPMNTAAFLGHFGALQGLLQIYPDDVNRVCQAFCTPVLCSVFSGSSACLNHLLGICLGEQPLLSAVISYNTSEEETLRIVNRCLGLGMDTNACIRDLLEDVPILAAAKKGWNTIVDALFEHTNPIEAINDWTPAGVLNYAQTEEQNRRTQVKMNLMRARIMQQLEQRNLLAASVMIKSIRHGIDAVVWDRYDSFCGFMVYLGVYCSYEVPLQAAKLMFWADYFLNLGMLDKALMGAKSCLVLDANDRKHIEFYNSVTSRMEAASSSSARTSM